MIVVSGTSAGRNRIISEDAGNSSETAAQSKDKRRDARTRKTIRFSGPEWELIERAATKRGMLAAEYVRMATLDAAEGKTAALTAEIDETIRRILRSIYILSTLKHDEMLHEGRDDEMEKTIKAARESQSLAARQHS